MTIPQYLAATGQDQQEFVDDVRAGAREAVRADLALRAVVAQEEIDATDEEVEAEIDRLAEQVGEKPAKVRKDLERRGVLEAVRSDIARGKALAFLDRPRGRGRRRRRTRSTCPSRSPPELTATAPPPTTRRGIGTPRPGSTGAGTTGRGASAVSDFNNVYVPNVIEQTHRGERDRRHLLAAAQGAHHLPRHPDRRRRRQPRDRAAAAPRERGPRQGHHALHQLAGRRDHRSLRHLRHDAVHQARRVDHLHRPGGLGGRGAARRRHPRQALRPPARPGAHPPAPRWRARVRRSTSRSRPRRSCACASRSTRSSPTTPARTVEKVARDTDRDFIMGAAEAKEYGIVDEVITNRELAAVGVPAGVS